MLRQRFVGLLAFAALPLLGGCAFHRDKNPHNDVLVFATQTKFGVDISAPATSATLPAFTVGYNRSEAVWMPLKPNGTKDHPAADAFAEDTVTKLNQCDASLLSVIADRAKRNAACLAAVLPAGKYVSMSSGIKNNIGGNALEIDTYSVFASFGARGGISGSQANGGLAQIFATGIAAQRLASNPQVGNALNVAAPAAAAEQAKAQAEEAKARQVEVKYGSGENQNRIDTYIQGAKTPEEAKRRNDNLMLAMQNAQLGNTAGDLIALEAGGSELKRNALIQELKKIETDATALKDLI